MTEKAEIYDNRICKLGEGPLWHPGRGQLFWFDIMGQRLMARDGNVMMDWSFDEYVSAAGWISDTELLVASSSALFRYDLSSGMRANLVALEADNPVTRSNDGRADRWGGFWIGTMGIHAEDGAGAIYRFHKGELRVIVDKITVSNAICFAPNAPRAYYTDTPTQKIMSLPLDPDTGWPTGPATVALDLTEDDLNPDGAVTDRDGNLWIAHWGAFCVDCYDPAGNRIKRIETGAAQTSCPAFGGPGLIDLYLTSASVGISAEDRAKHPETGKTWVARGAGHGIAEPRVIL